MFGFPKMLNNLLSRRMCFLIFEMREYLETPVLLTRSGLSNQHNPAAARLFSKTLNVQIFRNFQCFQ